MIKALIIIPNYAGNKRYIITLGIMYLSAYLKSKGIDVCCLNLNHYGPQKLNEVLKTDFYDAALTGGMYWELDQYIDIRNRVKKASPGTQFILGGPIASAHPQFAMEAINPDFLVIGEGELPSFRLLNAIKNKSDFKEVPGISFMHEGRFFQTTPPPLIDDLDSLPFPDYEGFEFERYLEDFQKGPLHRIINKNTNNRRIASIITSRDCPAKCTFCYRLTGGTSRKRSIDNVMEEIKYLVESYNINELVLLDDLFSATRDRVYEFCEKIKPFNIVWLCSLRVTIADGSLLAAMKDAGCSVIAYGVESASKTVLKSMKKRIDVKKIEKALSLTAKAKITVWGNLIFGDPAETMETVEETLGFYRRNKTTFSNSLLLFPIIPYPGTELYENLIANGEMTDLKKFYRTNMNGNGFYFNLTCLSDSEFKKLVNKTLPKEMKRNRFFAKVIRSKCLSKNKYSFTMVCPYCKEKSENVEIELSFDNIGDRFLNFHLACPECYQRLHVREMEVVGLINYLKNQVAFVKIKLRRELKASIKKTPLYPYLIKPILIIKGAKT